LQIGAKGALGKIACGCGKIPLFEHDRDFHMEGKFYNCEIQLVERNQQIVHILY
jgi:hypothetical protein